MRTLGNILWHIPFFGFVSSFITFLLGSILVMTVIGAPIGLGLIQLSKFLLAPFSHRMISKSSLTPDQNKLWKTFGLIVTICYIPIGLILVIVTICQIIGLFMGIFTIPLAIVLAKSLGTFFNPVNKVCVSVAVANELEARKAREKIDKLYNKKDKSVATSNMLISEDNKIEERKEEEKINEVKSEKSKSNYNEIEEHKESAGGVNVVEEVKSEENNSNSIGKIIAICFIALLGLVALFNWHTITNYFRSEDEIIVDYNTPKLIVEVDNAWVREYPSDGKVIANLRYGTECTVIKKDKKERVNGKTDYWYKIKFDDKEGWIFGSQTSLGRKLRNYSIPEKLAIDSNLKNGMCDGMQCLVDEFYPIGWSDNEKYFAWIEEPKSDAEPGYNFTIKIQDMVDDKIVWNLSFRESHLKNWDGVDRYDIVQAWNRYEDEIKEKLNQYDIIQTNLKYDFQKFPTRIGGTIYSIRIENKRDYSEREFGGIIEENVFINGEGLGSKRVFHEKHGKESSFVNSMIIGMIVSNNNNRGAVIKLNEIRGWEGPPHSLYVELIGSHLTKGFRK